MTTKDYLGGNILIQSRRSVEHELQGNIKLDLEADKPVIINDKDHMKTDKDEENFEALHNKDNTTMMQINTLDESVWETFARDLKIMGQKLKYVMFPCLLKKDEKDLHTRNWDLWGPLLLSLLLGLIINLSYTSTGNTYDSNEIFAITFCFIIGGSLIVAFNAKFLGGNISILGTVCVLGYCLFPICLFCILNVIFSSYLATVVRLLLALWALLWSVYASSTFIYGLIPENKKALAVYPCFLFFIILDWIALSM